MTVGLLPLVLALGELTQAQSNAPTAIAIEFDAPTACSSANAFYEGVRNRTARVRWALDGENATLVRIRLFRAGAKIKGELRLSDQEGEKETRKVDGSTCEEVVAALALTVTLALDPSALFTAQPAEVPTASTSPRVTFTNTVAKLPDGSARVETAPLPMAGQLELGAQWLGATVIRPGVSFGPTITGRYISHSSVFRRYSIALELAYLRNDLFGTASHGEFSLVTAGVEFCPWRTSVTSSIELGICALAVGGRLGAKGIDVSHSASSVRSWWAAGLTAFGSARIVAGLRLGLRFGGTVPLIRREFTESTLAQPVSSSPWVTFQSGLGFDYRF